MRTTTSRDGRAATPRSKEGGGGGGAASVGGKRVARGEAARAQVPRATHAAFEPSPTRADPVELLEFSKACAEQNERDFRRLDAAVDSGELVARTVGRRNPDRRHRHEHTPGPCRPRRGACAPPATSSARKGRSRSFPIRGGSPRSQPPSRTRAALHLAEHRQDPYPRAVPQAGRNIVSGRGCARRSASCSISPNHPGDPPPPRPKPLHQSGMLRLVCHRLATASTSKENWDHAMPPRSPGSRCAPMTAAGIRAARDRTPSRASAARRCSPRRDTPTQVMMGSLTAGSLWASR